MTGLSHFRIFVLVAAALSMAGCSGSGETPSCIGAGTYVATPSGPVLVEAVRVGDEVCSIDLDSGRRYSARVTAVRSAKRRCLTLTTSSGRSIRATGEHPFLSPETRGYETLSRWAAGELRQVYLHDTERGPWPERVLTCRERPELVAVFDLTVDSADHNFLANGFVVHNKTEAGPPLDVSGTWTGSWTAFDGESGSLTTVFTSVDHRTTGTAEIQSGTCSETAQVEGNAFAASVPRPNFDGTLAARLSSASFALLIEGTVAGGRITGKYQVLSGTVCTGPSGEFELSRDAITVPGKPLSSIIWVVLEDGEVQGLAESIQLRQSR